MGTLHVRRLGYALGAEITGLDLNKHLSDDVIAQIRAAWIEHIVLCFPGKDWSPSELSEFCSRFGELDDNRRSPFRRRPECNPIVMVASRPVNIEGKEYSSVKADKWHSDFSYTDRPATASFLTAKQLPDVGGDTMFANMYTAYETLSPAMQRLLDPLEAVHDVTMGANFGAESPEVQAERRRLNPPVIHPVVRVHPESGRKCLYLGERVRNFVGMTTEETQPMLDFLNRHATRYEFSYRHRWTLHDLLMWDNRSAMHFGVLDFDRRQLRRMERCALLAPKSGRLVDPEGGGARQALVSFTSLST